MTRCHCEARLLSVIARHNVPKQSRTPPRLPRLGPSLRSGFQLTAMTMEKVKKMNDLELNTSKGN